MRVLRTYLRTPPKPGGMEKHIKNLTLYQNEEHSCNVCFNTGKKITDLDIQILPFMNLSWLKPNSLGVICFYFILCIHFTFSQKQRYDVLHIHGDWSSLLFANWLKELISAKAIVFSIHDQIINDFQRNMLVRQLNKVDLIFTSGEDTKDYLGLYHRNVICGASGIEKEFFQHMSKNISKTKSIITVANLVPKKNIELVIKIAKLMPNYEFHIVGNGPLLEKLKDDALQLNNVYFHGRKNIKEIIYLLDQSSIFLLTSNFEGTPTSVLEACARGLPVVTSKVGGLENKIEYKKNGIVINTYDPDDYVIAINSIMDDFNLINTMNQNNRILAEEFSMPNFCKNITNRTMELLK